MVGPGYRPRLPGTGSPRGWPSPRAPGVTIDFLLSGYVISEVAVRERRFRRRASEQNPDHPDAVYGASSAKTLESFRSCCVDYASSAGRPPTRQCAPPAGPRSGGAVPLAGMPSSDAAVDLLISHAEVATGVGEATRPT